MHEPPKKYRNWLFILIVLVLAGVFLVMIAIPHGGSMQARKAHAIENNLRILDAAKQQWAWEHGLTNNNQILEMTNQLSEKDLSPYLSRSRHSSQSSALFDSVAGEKYFVKPLNDSPEVILVRKIGMPWPRGSIMRFGSNGVEIIFPDKTKIFF